MYLTWNTEYNIILSNLTNMLSFYEQAT